MQQEESKYLLKDNPAQIQSRIRAVPKKYADVLVVIFGALLPLAFAPFNIFILGILIPALLLWMWFPCTPKRALWRGFLFGCGFFGVGISWVYASIHTYGQANVFVAGTLTVLFVLLLACFPAIQGYVLTKFFPKNTLSKCLLAFPASWVLLEWAREWLFVTGFPWLYLGYSQMETFLRGYAPIESVFAVSWMSALSGGILAAIFFMSHSKKHTRWFLVGLLLVIWLLGFALTKITWTQPINAPVQISLIQGNIPQELKWNREQTIHSLNLYKKLTEQHWDSSIIIWPEAAITVLQTQAQDYLNMMGNEARAHNRTIISGIPIELNDKYYNGLLAFGDNQGMYLKRHLVPFGEYMPLRSVLNWLINYIQIPMSDFSSGAKNQPLLMINNLSIVPFICYEIAYPGEVLQAMHNAQLIVTLTDDSWFGRSIAPMQHIQMAQMRALETGRYLVMSTNNGITAIIDSKGQILQTLVPFETAVLTGDIQAMTGSTPWMYLNVYPLLILLAIALLLGYYQQKKKKNK